MISISKSKIEFESERVRLSHDLLKNQFGAILLPGWSDSGDRGTDRDVVIRALEGETSCHEALEGAVRIWCQDVFPALDQLIHSVSSRYGFVPTDIWERECWSIERADGRIRTILDSGEAGSIRQRAAVFWAACDTVKEFLINLRKCSWKFFERWDAELITLTDND